MAVAAPRRRKRESGNLVRGVCGFLILVTAAFALHHPTVYVLRKFKQPGSSVTGDVRDSRNLAATFENRDYFHANTTIGDEIAHLGEALLKPPKEMPEGGSGTGTASRSDSDRGTASRPDSTPVPKRQKKKPKKGCIPTMWTGNPGDYNLTKAAIACVADTDGVVMVTWANWHYHDFVQNWIDHVRSVNVSAYMVGAMDKKLLEALARDGVHTFSMDSGLTTGDFGWGSATFHKMGREKIGLINTFTALGFSILVSDVDTVWMRNPLPYMAQYPQADCLTSSDHLAATAKDGGLEFPQQAGSAANIGIMLVRVAAQEFAKEWLEAILKDDNYWDQNAFNDLMRRGANYAHRDDRLFMGYDGKYKFGILPVSMFCSGHTFFTQRMPAKLGMDPYVIHATFQFSGTPGKRNRFREALLWNDPPEYFDRPAGFLGYTPDIPTEMLKAAVPPDREFPKQDEKNIKPQFDLIHHQLLQLRGAWAISQTLGRALIFPEFWSGQDRYWAPHNGRLPGSELDLPFLAPADHILDLEQMAIPREEAQFGPMIEYREHSFLRNRRMPESVRRSRVHINVCRPEDDQGRCSDGSAPAAEYMGHVYLRPGLTDVQIRRALEPYKDRRIMLFSSMLGLFKTFEDHDAAMKFEIRLKNYASIWCCIDVRPAGHVFYDFFFDQVPHIDRFDRRFDAPWEIKMGP